MQTMDLKQLTSDDPSGGIEAPEEFAEILMLPVLGVPMPYFWPVHLYPDTGEVGPVPEDFADVDIADPLKPPKVNGVSWCEFIGGNWIEAS